MNKSAKAKKGKTKKQQEVSVLPLGPVELELERLGIPLTRESWLDLAYPFEGPPEPTMESELEMPEHLRLPEFRNEE
jgi:hypothetical protein